MKTADWCGLLFLGLENNGTIVATFSFAWPNNSPQSAFYTDSTVNIYFLRHSSITFDWPWQIKWAKWVNESWVNESMSQTWKNKCFSRNNKIKHYFYFFCLPPSLLLAQGLFLTWNLALGYLLAVPRPCRIAEAKNNCECLGRKCLIPF